MYINLLSNHQISNSNNTRIESIDRYGFSLLVFTYKNEIFLFVDRTNAMDIMWDEQNGMNNN